MEVLDEKIVAWAQAKKLLDKKSKEKELGYEQKNALEHLSKFSKIGEKKNTGLLADLGKIEKLKDRQRVSIVNTLPATLDEMKALFAHEIINLSDDEKKKILHIVKKYT